MRKFAEKRKVLLFTSAFLFFAAVLFSFAAVTFLRLPFGDVALFLCFQLFALALPGLTVLKLFRLKLTPLETLTLGYACGLLVNITVYFLLAPLYLQNLIPYVICAAAVLSALYLLRTRSRRQPFSPDRGEVKTALIFALLTAAMTFILLSASTLTPDVSGARGYFHDLLNGVSLITSASFGFPMEFLQMAFTKHFYHPFFYACCAVMKLCLGFDSFSIATNFSLITIAPFFASAFICLARKVFSGTKPIILSAALLYLLSFPMIYYTTVDLLGFPLGLAFMLAALLLFIRARESETRYFNRCHVLSALFVVAATGAKGPIGVNAVFSICFVLLLDLIHERRLLKTAATGLLYAVSFFGAYFLLYRQGAESMYLRSGLRDEVNRGEFYTALPGSWSENLRRLVSNITYTFSAHRLTVVCFTAALVLILLLKKKRSTAAEYAVGGAAIGFVLTNVFLQHGSSEIYFVYAVIPVALTALVLFLVTLFEKLRGKSRVFVLPLVCLALTALLFEPAAEVAQRVPPMMAEPFTYSAFGGNKVTTDEQIASMSVARRANSITPLEYEGLRYIRENTDKDSVIAEGRHLEHNKFFYGSALGERRFYVEGWGYVTMEDSNENTPVKVARESVMSAFFLGQDEGFIPLLQHSGIDYVVIYDYFNPGWKLTGEFGSKLVFENAHIAVYDISQKNLS